MATSRVEVRRATLADLDSLVPLFDAYRQFCRHPSEPERAAIFLRERLEHHQSEILLAFAGDAAVGFTQLYPSFSSGALARIYVLGDLFVATEARRRGTGSALLNAATRFAREAGAVRLVLATAVANTAAQSVYEKLGWKRDTEFHTYKLRLGKPRHG